VEIRKPKSKKRKIEGVFVYCSVVRLFMGAAAEVAADIFYSESESEAIPQQNTALSSF